MTLVDNFSRINKSNGLMNKFKRKDRDKNRKNSRTKCTPIKHSNSIVWGACLKIISRKQKAISKIMWPNSTSNSIYNANRRKRPREGQSFNTKKTRWSTWRQEEQNNNSTWMWSDGEMIGCFYRLYNLWGEVRMSSKLNE